MILWHSDSSGRSEVTNRTMCAPLASVTSPIDNLPDDLESLKRLLAAEHAARIDAEANAANAEAAAARATANVSSAEALIAHLKLAIEKMRRELYGSRSERGRKLVESEVLDQMEFELEDLEAAASEDELAAEMAAARTGGETTLVPEHARRKPVRKPFSVNGGVKAGRRAGGRPGQIGCGRGLDAPGSPRRRWPGFRSRGDPGF